MKAIIALSVLFGSCLCFEKYNYRLSGEDWTMGQCGAAKSPRQSPINIPKADSPDSSLLRVANNMKVIMWMGTHETCLLHNGMYDDTVQGEVTNGFLVFVDGQDQAHQFQLSQFHVHAPAEHLIGGK